MNAQRRKAIASIHESLMEAHALIDGLRGEESDYLDAMPEAFQYGEKGEKAEEAMCAMDDALSSLEEAAEYLDQAMQ